MLERITQTIGKYRRDRERDIANTAVLATFAREIELVEIVPKRQFTVVHRVQPGMVAGDLLTTSLPVRTVEHSDYVMDISPTTYGVSDDESGPQGASYGLTTDGRVLRMSGAQFHGTIMEMAVEHVRVRDVAASSVLVATLGQVAALAQVPAPDFQV